MEPDPDSSGEICLVAAAPSVTPWSVRRDRAARRDGRVDAVFATVASLADTGEAPAPQPSWPRRGRPRGRDHPRNLPDEVIKAVAGSGGVIGLCAFPSFVSPDPRPTLDQPVDHEYRLRATEPLAVWH